MNDGPCLPEPASGETNVVKSTQDKNGDQSDHYTDFERHKLVDRSVEKGAIRVVACQTLLKVTQDVALPNDVIADVVCQVEGNDNQNNVEHKHDNILED